MCWDHHWYCVWKILLPTILVHKRNLPKLVFPTNIKVIASTGESVSIPKTPKVLLAFGKNDAAEKMWQVHVVQLRIIFVFYSNCSLEKLQKFEENALFFRQIYSKVDRMSFQNFASGLSQVIFLREPDCLNIKQMKVPHIFPFHKKFITYRLARNIYQYTRLVAQHNEVEKQAVSNDCGIPCASTLLFPSCIEIITRVRSGYLCTSLLTPFAISTISESVVMSLIILNWFWSSTELKSNLFHLPSKNVAENKGIHCAFTLTITS